MLKFLIVLGVGLSTPFFSALSSEGASKTSADSIGSQARSRQGQLLAKPPPKKEALESILQQAREHTLKHQREEASRVLVAAIEGPMAHTPQKQELITELDQLSTLFYTEKSQKEFELAESLYYTAKGDPFSHYQTAQKNEAGNLLVSLGEARVHLLKKDCSAAQQQVQGAKKIHPYHEDVALLMSQVALCLSESSRQPQALEELDFSEPLSLLAQYLRARRYLLQNQLDKSVKDLEQVVKREATFPEVYYWLWKLKTLQGEPAEEWAQKYISLCKSVTSEVRRRYKNEPRLCQQVKEIGSDRRAES